ncbi:uncharacterized protein DUF4234 [Georgenia muralis]|uniref:Uncharacterized protein DUF4234 n=1 Tax=Georgenia muralis TaxID=154117 RepID=A0A3N4Z2S7_9MICO|nr:uncharacterized protein DUF4234 [Georgenia muralis]
MSDNRHSSAHPERSPWHGAAGPHSGQARAPVPANRYVQLAPTGTVRGTGTVIVLMILTLGLYRLYWYYSVHDEMRRHTGTGIGGGAAVLIALFAGVVSPFLVAHTVGRLYESRSWRPPVSALTGLWVVPGAALVIGPLIWFVRTNGALNDFWRGARLAWSR